MLTIACVLKSGGDYDPGYVANLCRQFWKHHPDLEHEFVCLTDWGQEDGEETDALEELPITVLPLRRRYPGWWSKLEAFRVDGPTIYLDLDTAILGPLDQLLDAVQVKKCPFIALRPFKATEKWASGVMGWHGQINWLFYEFMPDRHMALQWDQRYLSFKLAEKSVPVMAVQDILPGVYSYKHHCRPSIPEDANLVCFHGKPRPRDVGAPFYE